MVVDCDLRRAQMHQRLDLSREPGFTDYFVEPRAGREAPQAHVDRRTSSPSPRARCPRTRRRSSPASRSAELFDELRAEFDWVLVDSPPLASVTDALLLARQADHTVLVVQHNKVDKKLIKRSVIALHKATPHLLGAVLNVVDVRARSYQYYYYPQREGEKAGEDRRPARTTRRRPRPRRDGASERLAQACLWPPVALASSLLAALGARPRVAARIRRGHDGGEARLGRPAGGALGGGRRSPGGG